jgi:hypothetical protein
MPPPGLLVAERAVVLVEPSTSPAELRHLLDNPVYLQRALEVGEHVRPEDGVRATCDALEGFSGLWLEVEKVLNNLSAA